jgi:hypothetical protein
MAACELHKNTKIMTVKNLITNILSVLIVSLLSIVGYSQESNVNENELKEYAENIFTGTVLINSQTTTTLHGKSWSFGIQHRFGQISLDSTIVQQFLGLDLPSVIRFSFGRAFSDRFYIEVGRTNYLKTVDLEAKYLIVKQTADFNMPISIAAYFNSSIRTESFPDTPDNSYFEDGITPFAYKTSHRFAYNTQLIISSKVSDKFSIQVSPVFIYQNLAEPFNDNFTLVLSGGGRYKIGLNSAIIAEYAYVFNNRGDDFHNPFSAGVEFGTAGHTFQVFISSASKILESHIYTTSAVNMSEGEFLIGFNLKRVFWRKK